MESETFGSSKRPLTDVKEEPLEREEDFEMIDSFRQEEDYKGMTLRPQAYSRVVHELTLEDQPFHPRLSHHEWSLDDPEVMRMIEYDLREEQFDGEFLRNPNAKRQRPDLSPLSGLASKMGSRMPSFSRKWRSRKASPSVSIPPLSREASVSRANSTRALSITSAHGTQPPPTPAASVRNDSTDQNAFGSFSQVQNEVEAYDEVVDQAKPSTPLLPPLMTDHHPPVEEEYVQSPLQSPSVADPGASSVLHSPVDVPQTPQIPGYPSPPLSTKPSTASFHRRQHPMAPLVPSTDIPPMLINGPPQDKWADRLGHANFSIQPEPYTPDDISLETCKRLRLDWESARSNYAKHLMRVEENTGPTSNIFALTEEKWTEIDATWKRNVDAAVTQLNAIPAIPASDDNTMLSAPGSPVMSEPVGRELAKTLPLVKIPALNGPHSAGKFPVIGDEGIVGPMEVGPVRIEVIEQQ